MSRLFNKTRKENDNPNFLIFMILLFYETNFKFFNKTRKEKDNNESIYVI